MLKQLPEIGHFVRALVSDDWDCGTRYQTKGVVYEIEGISDISEAVYFIGDLDEKIYIDTDPVSLSLYELYEEHEEEKSATEKLNTRIDLIGSDIHAWNYNEDASDFELKFRMMGSRENTLKAIDSLQEDIVKLIKDKC